MGLETVLERIQENGRAEAAEIGAEARRERERMLQEVRAEGERVLARLEGEAREQAARRRVQDLARAELEAKRSVLQAQEQVLSLVRDKARERLAAVSDPERLRKTLAKHASEWRGGRVYSNARDAATVRSMVGGNFGGTIDCIGGLVLESADGTRRLDLTHDSILKDLWVDVVKEVAQTLWPRS